MKLKMSFVFGLMILLALVLVGCGSPATPAPTPTPTTHPGQAIISSRCIGCHDLNRIANAAYDPDGWQLTVDRMVLTGAQLSEDQVTLVVDYLAQTYPKE